MPPTCPQTSVTLTFAVYFMALHPDVLRRVREEVLQKFGGSRNPTYEELRDMKYLRAVINGRTVGQRRSLA